MTAKKDKYTLEELLKTYTPEEIAEGYVFPVTLTPEEQKEAAEELKAARKRNQTPFTPEDEFRLKLLRLRFMMENYFKGERRTAGYSFGYFLKEYIDILQRKRKDFAAEIDVDPTLLSQLINNRREPPQYIYFRLEIHSDKMLPADYWHRVIEQQHAYNIKTDKLSRQEQRAFVRNKISVSPKKDDKSDIQEEQA